MPSFVDPSFVDPGFVEEKTLTSLLYDPTTRLNIGVEIQSIKRSNSSSRVWYFTRFLDSVLRRSRPDFLPFLRGVGSYTQILSEDLLVGGIAQQSAGAISLLQENPDTDLLSQLLDYSFAGLTCTIKLGELGVDDYSLWQTFATASIDQEPTFSLVDTGIQLTFPLASIVSRLLSEQLSITRNVGIPTCLRILRVTGSPTVPHLSAYDLSEFTISAKFRTVGGPSSTLNLRVHTKGLGDTNTNWNIRVLQTSGLLNLHTSSGGVSDVNIVSASSVGDDKLHTVIVSFSTLLSSCYLNLDGQNVGTAVPIGPPDFPAADITFGNGSIEVFDARLIDRYIPEDEAVSMFSTRSNGDELGCIGLWRFDDNNDSATETQDYSPTANNAHLHGVVNTDYAWKPTNAGEPEQAGTPQPLVLGTPFNARAPLIDHFRSRFRTSDVDIVDVVVSQSIDLYSRELPLALTTDYTHVDNGVYQTVGVELEPITYDIQGGGSKNYLPNVLRESLAIRTPHLTINSEQLISLSYLCPWSIGYYLAGDLNGSEFLSQLCASSGFSYYEDIEGRLYVDFLLPPIGLGPYGQPCLDFRGRNDNKVVVGNTASVSGSHTLAAWFYTHAVDSSANLSDTLQTPPIGQFLIDKGNNYSLSVDLEGGAAGRINFSHLSGLSLGNLYAPSGLIVSGTWQFISGVLNDSAKTRKIYYSRLGSGTLSLVASDSGWTGSPTPNTDYLTVGGTTPSGSDKGYTWGSVTYAQVWNRSLSQGDIFALSSTPPIGTESGLIAYVPAVEGEGSTTREIVSGNSCTVGGSVWAPTLTINLNIHSSIKLTDIKYIIPASKIVIRYRRNWSYQMSDSDIASTASASRQTGSKTQWSEVEGKGISGSGGGTGGKTRIIILETCLVDRDDALRLLRFMQYRFRSGMVIATLEFTPTPGDVLCRRVLASSIGDEVFVISSIPHQWVGGKVLKVVGLSRDPFSGTVKMVVWG